MKYMTIQALAGRNSICLSTLPAAMSHLLWAYGSKLYGRSTIKDVASYIENEGKNIVGGINGDYFVLDTGLPIGVVVTDGILRSSDAWQNAVGFNADGTAIIGRPEVYFRAISYTKNYSVSIAYVNKLRTTSGVYLYNGGFLRHPRISQHQARMLCSRGLMTIIS